MGRRSAFEINVKKFETYFMDSVASSPDIDRSGATLILHPEERLCILASANITEQYSVLDGIVGKYAGDRYKTGPKFQKVLDDGCVSAVILYEINELWNVTERMQMLMDTFYKPDDPELMTVPASFMTVPLMNYDITMHGGISMKKILNAPDVQIPYFDIMPPEIKMADSWTKKTLDGENKGVSAYEEKEDIVFSPINGDLQTFSKAMTGFFYDSRALWSKIQTRPTALINEIRAVLEPVEAPLEYDEAADKRGVISNIRDKHKAEEAINKLTAESISPEDADRKSIEYFISKLPSKSEMLGEDKKSTKQMQQIGSLEPYFNMNVDRIFFHSTITD